MAFITGEVRLDFVRLAKPDDKGSYSVCVLINKDDEDTIALINEAVETCAEENKGIWGGKIPKNLARPLHDGDVNRDTDEYPQFEGQMYLNANTFRPPYLADADDEPLADPKQLYSGVYARIALEPSAYYHADTGKKGVKLYVNAVQKTRDGERIGPDTTSGGSVSFGKFKM